MTADNDLVSRTELLKWIGSNGLDNAMNIYEYINSMRAVSVKPAPVEMSVSERNAFINTISSKPIVSVKPTDDKPTPTYRHVLYSNENGYPGTCLYVFPDDVDENLIAILRSDSGRNGFLASIPIESIKQPTPDLMAMVDDLCATPPWDKLLRAIVQRLP